MSQNDSREQRALSIERGRASGSVDGPPWPEGSKHCFKCGGVGFWYEYPPGEETYDQTCDRCSGKGYTL